MQYHFAIVSAAQAAEKQAWSDIEASAGVFLSELDGVALDNLTPGGTAYKRMERWVEAYRPVLGGVLIVDSQWRLLFPRDDIGEVSGAVLPGRVIEWEALDEASTDPAEEMRTKPLHGKTTLDDGVHLAVANLLKNDQGYVLIHRPLFAVTTRARHLVHSLPAISVITFVWIAVVLGLIVYLVLAHVNDELDRERARSNTDTLRQTQDLVRTRDAVIFGLAKLAESRDPETGFHLERISVYSTLLANALHRHPKYSDQVTSSFTRLIGISSALHDIGKVGVEDRILLKRGRLTARERTEMQRHATIGGQCLHDIEQRLGGSNFLQMAREIAMGHHENWNGEGYPRGLSGREIPLSARIVAVADIYDALSSRRVYKESLPHEECVRLIREASGKKLDPDLVDVWLTIESKFRSIATKHTDRSTTDATTSEPKTVSITDGMREIEDLCLAMTGDKPRSG